MPATLIDGTNGSVTMPSAHSGATGQAYSWSLASRMRTRDVTVFGATRFPSKRGGMIDVSGSISALLMFDVANSAPGLASQAIAGASITLTAATGCTYGCTALFTNGRIDNSVDAIGVAITYDWEATGTVTETWDVA